MTSRTYTTKELLENYRQTILTNRLFLFLIISLSVLSTLVFAWAKLPVVYETKIFTDAHTLPNSSAKSINQILRREGLFEFSDSDLSKLESLLGLERSALFARQRGEFADRAMVFKAISGGADGSMTQLIIASNKSLEKSQALDITKIFIQSIRFDKLENALNQQLESIRENLRRSLKNDLQRIPHFSRNDHRNNARLIKLCYLSGDPKIVPFCDDLMRGMVIDTTGHTEADHTPQREFSDLSNAIVFYSEFSVKLSQANDQFSGVLRSIESSGLYGLRVIREFAIVENGLRAGDQIKNSLQLQMIGVGLLLGLLLSLIFLSLKTQQSKD